MTDTEKAFDAWWDDKLSEVSLRIKPGLASSDMLECWEAACAFQQQRDADQFFKLREEAKLLAEQVLKMREALEKIAKDYYAPGPDKGACMWCDLQQKRYPTEHDDFCVLRIAIKALNKNTHKPALGGEAKE